MLDQELRELKDRLLSRFLPSVPFSPALITAFGLAVGIASIVLICLGMLLPAFLLFLVNRFADIVDGAVARQQGSTSKGAMLDLFADYVIYLGVPLAIAASFPSLQILVSVMFALFVLNLLLWTYPQLLRPIELPPNQKYPRSLVEGTETTIFYCLFIMFPSVPLFLVFNFLLLITVLHRLFHALSSL